MAKSESSLLHISPDIIIPNPDNPRMIFREDELRNLYESIREVGIKVPISVYPERRKFVLLDGERRWKCACKLNLKSMPALVQPKPEHLENLLMMFNIHNVRVQWDPLPTAYKLGEIKDMLEQEGKHVTPQVIASMTGLSVGAVKRSFDLLTLPQKYQRMLLKEAEKPKAQQKFNVDLFVEINKAVRTIEKHTPEVFKQVPESKFVASMFEKYRNNVEKNVINFRNIGKIAKAEKKGVLRKKAATIIIKLAKERNYSIDEAYRDSVKQAYELADIASKTSALAEALKKYRSRKVPEDLRISLLLLKKEINKVLGNNK